MRVQPPAAVALEQGGEPNGPAETTAAPRSGAEAICRCGNGKNVREQHPNGAL